MRAWFQQHLTLSTVITVLSLMGVTAFGVIPVIVQRAPLYLFAYAFQTQAVADSVRTDRMIQRSQTMVADTLGKFIMRMDKRFNRLEVVVGSTPAAVRAWRKDSIRAAEDDAARRWLREPEHR